MLITLTDSDGNVYTLPSQFVVKSVDPWPITYRTQSTERAFSPGSRLFGDKHVNARKLLIEGKVVTSDYGTTLSSILVQLHKKELRLAYTQNRYANVVISRFLSSDLMGAEGDDRFSDFEIEFEMLDPFFYGNTICQTSNVVANADTQFLVNNLGDVETYPTITFLPVVSITSLSIQNDTDDGMVMFYRDIQLINGTTLIVNSVTGLVTRDGEGTIHSFSGNFLKLNKGNNLIKYISNVAPPVDEATLAFTWRCAFLHAEGNNPCGGALS